MCGITGFVDKIKKDEKNKIIKKMANRIIHRGPDSDGYYVDSNVALGFRRLAIIDLKTGNQPIYNENKTIAVIFNGEIYNYQELRKELEKQGHKFMTNTDTEVLVHGYEEYKTDLFIKLRGMFAFALYDIKNKELICVRDLYYYYDNKVLMFGSEIKSFLEHPNNKKELNEDVLKLYLSYGT